MSEETNDKETIEIPEFLTKAGEELSEQLNDVLIGIAIALSDIKKAEDALEEGDELSPHVRMGAYQRLYPAVLAFGESLQGIVLEHVIKDAISKISNEMQASYNAEKEEAADA